MHELRPKIGHLVVGADTGYQLRNLVRDQLGRVALADPQIPLDLGQPEKPDLLSQDLRQLPLRDSVDRVGQDHLGFLQEPREEIVWTSRKGQAVVR